MKLFYYQSRTANNFGDELNPWLWNKIFPNLFDNDSDVLVTGMGTILNGRVPKARKIIVLGSGVGYGKAPVIDDSWHIYWLRGPLSARQLRVSAERAITDSAYLIPTCHIPDKKKAFAHSFMPHISQSKCCDWEAICADLGMGYIDPDWETGKVLSVLENTQNLITEALHGAIVADAFRIPWMPVVTKASILRFKWEDWCASMDLKYSPLFLWPPWKGGQDGLLCRMKRAMKARLVKKQLRTIMSRQKFFLSKRNIHLDRIRRMEARLEDFRSDLLHQAFLPGSRVKQEAKSCEV
ncbi:MAG: polysaccharide pyruvyl transferase family protein [Candidatus Omnitrophota bacterium]